MPVKPSYLFLTGVGGILFYSGFKGKSFSSAFRNILAGQPPGTSANANTITGGINNSVNYTSEVPGASQAPNPIIKGTLKSYALTLLIAHGWTGQWGSFNNIVNAESGWNSHVKNIASGAYGIAQALGHGTPGACGTESCMYGANYGLSTVQAVKANSGNGYYQLRWMAGYIQSRYGDPDHAWAYHLANNSY